MTRTAIKNGELTGAELRSIRELLGLSPAWLAKHLEIREREYTRMEQGTRGSIYRDGEWCDGGRIARSVNALAEEASDLVEELVSEYEHMQPNGTAPALFTYRTDLDYEEAQYRQGVAYEKQKPVRWHHHICARVADEVDVRIAYVSLPDEK
jgi:hypothetical protein